MNKIRCTSYIFVIVLLAVLTNWPRQLSLAEGALVSLGFPFEVILWSFGRVEKISIAGAIGNGIAWILLLLFALRLVRTNSLATKGAGAKNKTDMVKTESKTPE